MDSYSRLTLCDLVWSFDDDFVNISFVILFFLGTR